MNKKELVTSVSRKEDLDPDVVLQVLESIMLTIKETNENGEPVWLRGFGGFILRVRAEKTGRNISKGTTVIIPEHNFPVFKPAKCFIKAVKDNNPVV